MNPENLVTSDANVSRTGLRASQYWQVAVLVFVVVVATGLPQPGIIGRLPITNVLKNSFHESQSQVASFFLIATIPWLLMKPVLGLISDAFPIFGTKRRYYLMISAGLSALAWIAFLWVPHTHDALLAACFVVNVFMAFGSTVGSAVMVDAGRSLGALGRLTSVRVAAESVLGIFQGPLGGLFAGLGLSLMAGANVAIVLSLIPIAYLFLKERPQTVRSVQPFKDAGRQIKALLGSRTVWLVLLVTMFFYFSPGFGTVQLYRQQNEFGLSMGKIGLLMGISSVFGLAMAFAFPALSRKWDLKTLVAGGIILVAGSNLLYLVYSRNFGRDAVIDAQSALFYTLCELTLYTLAARATPAGCEGMGFSLMIGFRNLCLLCADVLGSNFSEHGMAFWKLLALNSGTTLCVLLLLPFLPNWLLTAKDRIPNELAIEDLAVAPA